MFLGATRRGFFLWDAQISYFLRQIPLCFTLTSLEIFPIHKYFFIPFDTFAFSQHSHHSIAFLPSPDRVALACIEFFFFLCENLSEGLPSPCFALAIAKFSCSYVKIWLNIFGLKKSVCIIGRVQSLECVENFIITFFH